MNFFIFFFDFSFSYTFYKPDNAADQIARDILDHSTYFFDAGSEFPQKKKINKKKLLLVFIFLFFLHFEKKKKKKKKKVNMLVVKNMLVLCFILLFIATANAVTNEQYVNLVINDPQAAGLINPDGNFWSNSGRKYLDNDSSRQFYYNLNTSASPKCINWIEIKGAGWVENASILDPLVFETANKPHLCVDFFKIVSTKLTGSLSIMHYQVAVH